MKDDDLSELIPVDVTIAQQVYEHYQRHQQSVPRALAMYGWLAMKLRPHVDYVEGARAQLSRLTRRRAPLLISANHISEDDPLVLAAAGFRSPLRPRIGHIRVLAKDELFADPEQRRKIDALGGIPVFRTTDHGMRAALLAGQQMIDTCVHRILRHDSIAIFPEGTCNTEDPATVQKLNSGVGHIAHRALSHGAEITLVSAAITYAHRSGRPAVTFGYPVAATSLDATTPAAITRHIQADLQSMVERAAS